MRKNLRDARKKAGLSQKELAEKLDITLRTYGNIERGEFCARIWVWDMLEDMFGIHQRILRENEPDE